MGFNWQRGVLRLLNVANHPVTVTRVQNLTPWYRRITFHSPELIHTLEPFPTLWLRLWIPNAHGTVVQRGYTFVRVDGHEGTFDLDFVLHDTPGPAGDWAKTVTVGSTAEVALTPAKISIPDGTSTMILAGDSTALPAINSWLEQIPSDVAAEVYLAETHPDREKLPLARAANTSVHWADGTAALAQALARSSAPASSSYGWAAGEKDLVKAVRPIFAEQLGLDRHQRFSQFYWIHGKNMDGRRTREA